jgi:AraC-like DNA-binding protein
VPGYAEQASSGSLARWVECAWVLETASPIPLHRVPPDGCVDIVYDRAEGLRAVGAMTVEQRFDFPSGAEQIGIRFRPGMAGAFLGVSPAELTDCTAPLGDLQDRRAGEIQRRLDDARSIRDAMRLLLAGLPVPERELSPVQRAIEALAEAKGNADLNELAHQANLSPRQFRRRCLEESGLAPKHLARVLRFRHACTIARRAQRVDWADVAFDAGYFDQSHLIRDFREFTGGSPTSLKLMAVLSNTAESSLG